MSATSQLRVFTFWILVLASACNHSQNSIATHPDIQVSLRSASEVSELSLIDENRASDDNTIITGFSVAPALPDGLNFDPSTGAVSGTPTIPIPLSAHTVYQWSQDQIVSRHQVSISIDKALPERLQWLTPGFNAEVVLSDASIPVRMALAPDGRLFYAELQTGQIRIVSPQTGLLAAPFARVDVASGEEKGILGLALDPQFSTNGYVYVHATVRTNNTTDQYHAQIIRYAALQNLGVNPTVLVDHLPAADLHNGGDILFDHQGNLFVGRGDLTAPHRAQLTGDTAGKVLRYTKDGGVPADNPFPGSAEWARGLRNTFALALHPHTGDLFGADAGPASDDKLNFLSAGKNFLWGMQEEPQGHSVGYSIRIWPEVITPTALLFHSGNGGFDDYRHQLFVTSYNSENIRVVHLTGDAFTDFIKEETFAEFETSDFSNKPLHVIEAPDGSLYVSTFDTIYRVYSSVTE